jgi:hypothetical protein
MGMLRPVYHGEHGLRTLRELGRSYQTLSQDLNRVDESDQSSVSRLEHPLCRLSLPETPFALKPLKVFGSDM